MPPSFVVVVLHECERMIYDRVRNSGQDLRNDRYLY